MPYFSIRIYRVLSIIYILAEEVTGFKLSLSIDEEPRIAAYLKTHTKPH